MSEVFDLDALVPPSVTVKFNNQEITVAPPKTGDILRLGALGQKMQNINDLNENEADELINKLTEVITKCIPELKDQSLNAQQLLKLVEILSLMAMPPDVKELEERGIGVSDPKVP